MLKKISSRGNITCQQCSKDMKIFTLNSASTILILYSLYEVTLPLFFFMCLTRLFSRELDLCVLNIKPFLDRFDMTLLFTVALRLFNLFC